MAEIPVPRSYSEIIGDMVEAFLSRFGLRSLKVGSPVLSILESVAQSQLRSSEDIFTLLDALSLDNASGDALDRIGADESTPRITQNPSSGTVSLSDTTFNKISSKVYQGTAAPIIGSTVINVVDASSFPATGSIYLGRGTTQYEGPIAYTSKTNTGTFWTLALSTPTQRFHNLGESVVVAQGGDRQVSAGTLVQTPQGNVSQAIQFKTLFSSTIPDGETLISGVLVVATTPGISGNIAAAAINGFASGSPFNNAAVTNPLPFTNGTSVEDDDSYRERIRQARQSRTKGTALAIQTNAVGVTATDENKRVLSASVVTRQGFPTTLYIDDGTGYEMVAAGVAIETLMDQALGGEQFFKVSKRPIAKAYVQSLQVAPFALVAGMKLGFAIGGVTTEHTFSDDGTFRNIGNATAYEVVASINADTTLNWQARTANQGNNVIVTAKADTNESIQNQVVLDGIDSNPIFGFSATRVDTVRLYRDDQLLSKDGKVASIQSSAPTLWSTLSGPQSLVLVVDGIQLNFDGTMFAKFQDQDFINAKTGYTTLGKNSLAAWASVFNFRIPGVTATVTAGTILLTSNRSTSATANVQILSGDLVTNHMFATGSATGAANDYTINRNTGEIGLTSALLAGSKLTTGSKNTRAFLTTPTISTINLAAAANLWLAIDANAQVIPSGLATSTSLTFTATATAYGFRIRCTAGSGVFTSNLAGDWVVFWDSALGALAGAYRINYVDPGFTFFEFDKATTYTAGPLTLATVGMQFARTTTTRALQKQTIALGTNYTASSLATALDTTLFGSLATTYRTNFLRLNTNTFSTVNGDIAVVAADASGQLVGLPISNAIKNLTGHMASIESVNEELGTPDFQLARVQAVTSQTAITIDRLVSSIPSTGSMLRVMRANDTGVAASAVRYSSQMGFRTSLADAAVSGGHFALDLNKAPEQTWLINDRLVFTNPFMIAPDDLFTVLVDGDVNMKRFAINMWRTIKPTTNTYTATNLFTDGDNGNASLATAFGSAYTFNDFAVYMPARGLTDSADGTRSALWRYYRLGPDGNNARVQYQNPIGPSSPVGLTIDNLTNTTTDIGINLAGGAVRTGYSIRTSTFVGVAVTALASGMGSIVYASGCAIASGTRIANTPTLTLTLPPGITNHGLVATNVIFVQSTDANYPSGVYTISSVTATTITYTDGSASVVAFAGTGDVSRDTAEATLTGGSVSLSDYWLPGATAGYAAFLTAGGASLKAMFVASAAAQNWTGKVQWTGGTSTTLQWFQVLDLASFTFFQNSNQTVATITAAVNALTTPIVTGKSTGTGLGTEVKSADEAAGVAGTWISLVDGVNYVKTTTPPGGNYQLVFKNPVAASLSGTVSDWANETIRIVPLTASALVEWFNTLGVSGLSSDAEIVASSSAAKVQLASLTAGSSGSLQVQGGTANLATAAVASSATQTINGSALVVQVPVANVAGMFAGQYVAVNNSLAQPKASVFDLNTNLTTIGSDGTFTFNAGGTPILTQRSSTLNAVLKFEKIGGFVCISDTGLGTAITLGSVIEGDYISLVTSATPTGGRTQIAAGNAGLFRVVRVVQPGFDATSGSVWIENSNFTTQNNAETDIVFLAPNSVLPGDVIQISTPLWGSTNLGRWTVLTVGGATAFGNAFTFKVDVSKVAISTSITVGALGSSSANLVQCIEGTPSRLIKKILGIAQNAVSPTTLADVKFDTANVSRLIGVSPASILIVLDKLAFPTTLAKGVDGYQYSTGLIGAVNKVEYGDPSDPATYPGVVAAGALVNIEGAPIKRIQVGIALRVRSGANTTFISQSAKSAVAAVINATGVGETIALIDIANAAKVPGVISVIMLSPQMVTGTDLISVQPYEKPRVLNLDQDILISFVGN